MKLSNQKFSLLIAEVTSVIYTICSAFVTLFPDLSTRLMVSLFHISGNINLGTRVTFTGFIMGLIQVFIYAYAIGWVFAWIFNRSSE